MTALAGMRSFRNPDNLFAATNELRTRGTDNLLAAAAEAGTRRVIAQSYAGAGPDKRPGPVKTEDDPPVTRRRSRSGCPTWRRWRARSRRCGCRPGSDGCSLGSSSWPR